MDQAKRAKLMRVERLRRRLPHMSASAFAQTLKELHDDPIDPVTRQDVARARDLVLEQGTPYGPILKELEMELKSGRKDNIWVCCPFAFLYTVSITCIGWANLLRRTLVAHPPSFDAPWRMIVYSDEVVPGNQLSFHNLRKAWVIYYSFVEFGMSVLSMEDAWICLTVITSDHVKQMSGGLPQVFSKLLVLLFGSSDSHNLRKSGIVIEFADESTARLFSDLEMVLQDGGAHKLCWCLKGDAGHKFCVGCRTLFAEKSGIVNGDNNEEILTCNLLLESEQDFATDEEIRGTVLRLAEFARTSPDTLALREQACGFNHNVHNMLLNPQLNDVVRPVTQFGHDWMHAMVVHGVWNTIMFLLILELIASGVGDAPTQFQNYVSLWTLPKRLGSSVGHLSDTFSPSRWTSSKKAKYLKCTASDAITLFPIIACYVFAVFHQSGTAVKACECYLALADFMDLLVTVAHGCVSHEVLREAVREFLESVVAAGWRNHVHPKFHWLVHFARELFLFGMLLSCWVHERKHKMLKRYSNIILNTVKFEYSVLSEVTCHHIAELRLPDKFNIEPRLLDPVKTANARLKTLLEEELQLPHHGMTYRSANAARVNSFEVVYQRDVILFQGALARDDEPLLTGELWQIAEIEGRGMFYLAIIVSVWSKVSQLDDGSVMTVSIDDQDTRVAVLSDVQCALTYRRKDNGEAQVLVPRRCRDRI